MAKNRTMQVKNAKVKTEGIKIKKEYEAQDILTEALYTPKHRDTTRSFLERCRDQAELLALKNAGLI